MFGWVNGNDYIRSQETFGILPLSDTARARLGFLPYHAEFAKQPKIHHNNLANYQATRIAVLPVHTMEEHALYRLFIQQKAGLFSGIRQPNWVDFAVEWSTQCNGTTVFYKMRYLITVFI
jgi:hypothetical protein